MMTYRSEEKLGWPSIECQFSFEYFPEQILSEVCVPVLKKISFAKSNPFLAGTESYEYIYGENLDSFVEDLSKSEYVLATINFEGILYDVKSKLCVQFDPNHKVLSITIGEDFIFKYTDDMSLANVDRLLVFFDLCNEISRISKPSFGVLSLEHYTPEEVSVKNAKLNGIEPFSEEMFSRNVAEVWVKQYRDQSACYTSFEK